MRLPGQTLPDALGSAQLLDQVEATMVWAPIMPEGEVTLEVTDEATGQSEPRRYMIERLVLERAHASYQAYLADVRALGADPERGEGLRPLIEVHDTSTPVDYGGICDTAVRPYRGTPYLWAKLRVTRALPTLNVSIKLEPEYPDPHTGKTYTFFIHHLGLVAFPRFKTTRIPDDPAIWEAAGLRACETPLATTQGAIMADENTQHPTPAPSAGATPATPDTPAVEAGDGEEVEAMELGPEEVEQLMGTIEQMAQQMTALADRVAALEEGMSAMEHDDEPAQPIAASEPAPPPSAITQQLSAIQSQLGQLTGLAQRTAALPTQEQGGGSTPPARIADTEQAIAAAEADLAGKTDDDKLVIALARYKQGGELSASKRERLKRLGVAV